MNDAKRYVRQLLTCLGLLAVLTACSRHPAPDLYPPNTPVVLTTWIVSLDSPTHAEESFQLGPKSARLFLDMLSKRPFHSNISEMPALPMGRFTVGGADYYWHGNGVIRGKGADERLWSGPYLQRLLKEVRLIGGDRESLLQLLNALEADDTVAATPLDGPGAYPGGGDALHPTEIRY
jgi:hypothetical protein